jgi:DNA-binding MarR family transcriptional regulator
MSELYKEIAGLDRLIHEPARLSIMALLYGVEEADFLYLLKTTGLSKGNLSAHISKLEEAGYVDVKKQFIGKKPNTVYRLTEKGRREFEKYLKVVKKFITLS